MKSNRKNRQTNGWRYFNSPPKTVKATKNHLEHFHYVGKTRPSKLQQLPAHKLNYWTTQSHVLGCSSSYWHFKINAVFNFLELLCSFSELRHLTLNYVTFSMILSAVTSTQAAKLFKLSIAPNCLKLSKHSFIIRCNVHTGVFQSTFEILSDFSKNKLTREQSNSCSVTSPFHTALRLVNIVNIPLIKTHNEKVGRVPWTWHRSTSQLLPTRNIRICLHPCRQRK
jgi:hypothetical protein